MHETAFNTLLVIVIHVHVTYTLYANVAKQKYRKNWLGIGMTGKIFLRGNHHSEALQINLNKYCAVYSAK